MSKINADHILERHTDFQSETTHFAKKGSASNG